MQRVLNILSIYHKASGFEIEAGLRWYLAAHDDIKRIATVHDCSISTIAAVVAVVSPGLRWERNIEAAERIIEGTPLDGLGVRWYDGVRKAERIVAGELPDGVLKGRKVRAFWDNLTQPATSRRVCVDGHAYAIWAGERVSLDETPNIGEGLYGTIERCYAEAAELVGVQPLQLQAITWTTWRRLHGVNSAHFLPLFEDVA